MALQWKSNNGRRSEILDKYYTFPVSVVRAYRLDTQEGLENFMTKHRELLRWWLGGYIPSYVKDITDNADAHPFQSKKWISSWQTTLAKCRCLVSHFPVFWLTLAHS